MVNLQSIYFLVYNRQESRTMAESPQTFSSGYRLLHGQKAPWIVPPDGAENWKVWSGDEAKTEFEKFFSKLSSKSHKAYLDWVLETARASVKPLRAIPSYVLNISEEFIMAYNRIVLTAAPSFYTKEGFTFKTLEDKYPDLAHSVLVGEEDFFDAVPAFNRKKNKQEEEEEGDDDEDVLSKGRGGRGGRGGGQGSKIFAGGSGGGSGGGRGGSGGGRAKDATDGKNSVKVKRKRLKEGEESEQELEEDERFDKKSGKKQKRDDEEEAVVDVSLHSKLSQALIAQVNFQTLHMIQAAISGLADVQAQTNALRVLVSAVIALLVSQADFKPEIQQECFQSLLETFSNSELAKHELCAKGAPTPALKVQAILSTLAEQVGLKQEMTKALKSWVV